MKNNKKLFFLIIIFIFIVSCGVKNNIERQSRQEVHDNEIGTFQIQKDWKKNNLTMRKNVIYLLIIKKVFAIQHLN